MAQIRQLQRAKPEFRNRRLCPRKFLDHQMTSLNDLHGGSYKRATFYFANGDDANIADYLISPEYSVPGIVRDLHFKFCGNKLKKSVEFDKFVEESVPQKFQGRFSKSEKGIDIEMCCDALRLASASRIGRLFLLTNDGDFIPFCRTVKEFGANISIIHLSTSNPPNADLLREADSYDVVPDALLGQMFTPPPDSSDLPLTSSDKNPEAVALDQEPQSEKPDTEPSDLSSVSDQMED